MAVPGPITYLEVIGYEGLIYLYWEGGENATGFAVLRDTTSPPTTLLASPTVNQYYDYSAEPGTTYYFAVYAYNDEGAGPLSEVFSAEALTDDGGGGETDGPKDLDRFTDARGRDVQYTGFVEVPTGEWVWHKPDGARSVQVWMVGGGGSGQDGYEGNGGRGGGGGGALYATLPAAVFVPSLISDTGQEWDVFQGLGGDADGNSVDARRGGLTGFAGFEAVGGFGGVDGGAGGSFGTGAWYTPSVQPGVTVTGEVGHPGGYPYLNTESGIIMGGEGGACGQIPWWGGEQSPPITAGPGGDGGFEWRPLSGGGIPQGQNGGLGYIAIITTFGVDNYLRLNQRDDGLGVSQAPRLAGTQSFGPTSLQRAKAPRVGTSNTYL